MAIRYLIDSNVIIYHLNGDERATSFLRRHIQESAISQITYLEVLSFGYADDTARLVSAFLDQFVLLDVTKSITLACIQNRKHKKIKVPDNIIAATAQVYNLTLVTHNTIDFSSLAVSVLDIFSTNV
jgi:predicted nucleic acid-binding protein